MNIRRDDDRRKAHANCSESRARPAVLIILAACGLVIAGRWSNADEEPTPEARQPVADKFKALDADKDGTLLLDEFTAAGEEPAWPRLARDFRVFDLDRDGRLTFDEFLNIPALVPPDLRGRLPDPIVELVQRWLEKIEREWKGWDSNGDGELSREEFAASGLAPYVPGLEPAKFEDWNRDGRAGISRDDCRSLLEFGCGMRRADGQLLRLPSGRVFNWMAFKHADTNHDDQIEHEEYMKSGLDGDLADARYREMDVDKNTKVSFAEWNAYPIRPMDPVAFFLQLDADFDGRVDKGELLKGEQAWRMALARHTFPGFDLDADGFLSLHEYRFTPMANPVLKWHDILQDRDNDGFLSPAEFQWEPGLEGAVLTAEYFRLLDINHDGRLDVDEFFFNSARRDPNRYFRQYDTDGDEVLNEAELALAVGDKPQAERLLKLFDVDGNRTLGYEEFLTVPGMAPLQMRGSLPDPIVKLVDVQLEKIAEKWPAWDKNGDKVLSRDEFQASGLARLVPGLTLSTWKDWDQDGNATVSREDCRRLLEIAFGIRRLTGEPLRFASGVTINAMLFGYADQNHDNRLDHDEFIKHTFQGEQAETRFRETDSDRDNVVTFAEWSKLDNWLIDPLAEFLKIDTDLDGRVDKAELLKGEQAWRMALARHTFPGFDLDADGFLSLHEYRLTPMANPVLKWHETLQDRDSDGFLSPDEFQWEPGLGAAALRAECFRLLDINHDGRLDLDEFFFNTGRRDPKHDFRRYDTDGDEVLNEAELTLATGDKPQAERLLKLFDVDGNRKLSYEEFLTVPGMAPMQMRGSFPDPIVKLVDVALERIAEKWPAWDKNADKVLSRDEFQASGLARLVPGLTLSTWKDWDQDGNGTVSREDCRRLLEIAFGIRRLTGEPLRFASGVTINAMLFGYADQNHDNRLDHDEFVKHTFQGEQAEIRLRETDSDHDDVVTFAEWSKLDNWLIDPIAEFLRIDADLDGRVDKNEFLKGTPQWQERIALHVFPGFDLDRDGFLSLDEYRRIPLANDFVAWHDPRRDSDNDGRLSAGDFQWGRRPEMACLEAEYFRCFDVNGDGSLDRTEFFLQIDAANAPREMVFRERDLDGDGKLSLDEVLGDSKPATGSKPDAGQEVRLARMEEAFRKADLDHDAFLNLNEFRSEAGLEAIAPEARAARAAASASATGAGPTVAGAGERSRMWMIVGGNVAVLAGVLLYVLMKK